MPLSRPAPVAIVAILALVGCAGAPPRANDVAVATVAPLPSSSSSASSASPIVASSSSAANSSAPSIANPAKICGCKLCEPVVSDDACATDADCAKESPCHAKRCVGVANAAPPSPGAMCTRIMMCSTADANACQCYRGKCALVPR